MAFKRPHHMSDRSKVVDMEKNATKYEIQPRGLNIVWGNDPRYWRIPENDDPAELIQVSWLEVSGSVPVNKGKSYRVSFKVSLTRDSFGWSGSSVVVMAKVGKRGQYVFKEVNLSQIQTPNVATIPDPALEITVQAGAPDAELYFGLYEVWSGKWKGGLQIHGANVEIVPTRSA